MSEMHDGYSDGCKKKIDELIESIEEYANATFEVESCGRDYYKCNMCESQIYDSKELNHLFGRSILDKIEHYDDCPYILSKKISKMCDE